MSQPVRSKARGGPTEPFEAIELEVGTLFGDDPEH